MQVTFATPFYICKENEIMFGKKDIIDLFKRRVKKTGPEDQYPPEGSKGVLVTCNDPEMPPDDFAGEFFRLWEERDNSFGKGTLGYMLGDHRVLIFLEDGADPQSALDKISETYNDMFYRKIFTSEVVEARQTCMDMDAERKRLAKQDAQQEQALG